MKIKIKEIKKLCKEVLLKNEVNDNDADIIVSEYIYG
jgi:LDH2 family malate/lactate/ureidoglycolate dehydrogenase